MKIRKIGCEAWRIGCALVVFGTALGATAADFYAKDNISDWTKAENFTMDEAGTIDATVVPGASADDADEVIVTGAKTVTIGDTASLARVNNLARIRPDLDAKIVFNIPEGAF